MYPISSGSKNAARTNVRNFMITADTYCCSETGLILDCAYAKARGTWVSNYDAGNIFVIPLTFKRRSADRFI
jgi:hypothetical protein